MSNDTLALMPTPATMDLSLYFITDPVLCRTHGLLPTVIAAVRGGATVVQLRDKSASDTDLITLGRHIQQALIMHPLVTFIINDRVSVAQALNAGLHLGQGDGDVAYARAQLGNDAIIGLSVTTLAQVQLVNVPAVNYLGIGPVMATPTKPDHAAPLGFNGLATLRAASPIPAVAIGGLTHSHAAAVRTAGVEGMAVISAICTAADPEAAARALWQAFITAPRPLR